MSLLQTEMHKTHAAVRGVSQGAAVTLVTTASGYKATLGCAKACADVLGTKHLTDYGMKPESLPVFTIPTEEMHKALTKLSETLSVALVDTTTDENGTRFVLVWRIGATTKAEELVAATAAEENLDEY